MHNSLTSCVCFNIQCVIGLIHRGTMWAGGTLNARVPIISYASSSTSPTLSYDALIIILCTKQITYSERSPILVFRVNEKLGHKAYGWREEKERILYLTVMNRNGTISIFIWKVFGRGFISSQVLCDWWLRNTTIDIIFTNDSTLFVRPIVNH